MTTKGFSLAEFSPEPMTFTDDGFGGDGRIYDVKTLEHLGARDTVQLQRLYERMSNAVVGKGGKQGAHEDQLAVQLEQTADELFTLLIPTLPAERHKAIPFQGKFRFLRWWREEQTPPPGTTPAQEGDEVEVPKPAARRGKVVRKTISEKSAPE